MNAKVKNKKDETFPAIYPAQRAEKLRERFLFRVNSRLPGVVRRFGETKKGVSRLSLRLVRHLVPPKRLRIGGSLGDGGSFLAKGEATIFFFLFAFSALAENPYYHIDRTFVPIELNITGTPTEATLYSTATQLTSIVKGTNIVINSNETYAIEKQSIAVGFDSAVDAWNVVTNYSVVPSNIHQRKVYNNVGWLKNVVSTNGAWGAYIWSLQNRLAFTSSATNIWISSNGFPVAISNVLVGSLGNYGPMSNVVDIGPVITQAFVYPQAGQSNEATYQVDYTNVFYELVIPDIWIQPIEAFACIGGSNVQFTVYGTNIPQGVTWTRNPALANGAEIQSNDSWQASVNPGNIATNYKIRATSIDNTNFYDEVNLKVCNVDIVETNVYIAVSNTMALHLTTNSSPDAQWEITPSLQNGASINGSSIGTSIVFNAGALPTNYIVRAYIPDFTNCYDTCTVVVLKTEIIFISNGDSANTYSTNEFAVTNYLASIGASNVGGGVWIYDDLTNATRFETHIITDQASFSEALQTTNAYVAFHGHSNYGIGFAWANTLASISGFFNVGTPNSGVSWPGILEQQASLNIQDSDIAVNPTNYAISLPYPEGWDRFGNYEGSYQGTNVPYIGTIPPSNVFDTIYGIGTNRFHYFGDSNSVNPTIILKVRYPGCDDLPTLRYKWLLIDGCNSDLYFTDPFNHGVVFYTTTLTPLASDSMKRFVQAVIEGKTENQLKTDLNAMRQELGITYPVIYNFISY